jgi:glycosyltransferase involved in cell wall biosynthesis
MSGAISVAAALIVKNEERFLPGCLESLRGRVNDVVIVDTGSDDATAEIATKAGARLLHHTWNEDFAAARNAGLDAISCDWVLYIDADERLRLPDGGTLGDYVVPSAIAAYVRFQPKTSYTRYREVRLFRSDPRLRFAGRIHETMTPVLRAISASEGLPIIQSQVEIDHLGYDGDQSHKHLRNLPLLEKAVKTHPDRVYYWYHLAETFAALGRHREALDAATEGLVSAGRDPTEKQFAVASMLTQTKARLLLELGEDPLPLIESGIERVPEDHGLWFMRGRALLVAGRPLEALEVAARLRNVDPDKLRDGLLAFDRGIFREKACELAALACLRLGRRRAAGVWFAEAMRLAPDVLAYRVKAFALLGPAAAQGRHAASG